MEQPRRYIKKRIRKTPYFLFYTYLLVVLLSLFSTASYTWFTLSRSPRVSNMNVYITTAAGLELSADPGAEEWTNMLDVYSTEELKAYQDPESEKPSLRQVTWSDSEQCFYGPLYGYDGRLMPLEGYDYSQMQIVSWYKLDDQINASKLTDSSYYIKATFYARCGQPTDVTLYPQEGSETVPHTYVIGDPNTGRGPETAVRMGFRMTYVDKAGNELSERSQMYVYEPNSDRHADGSTEYIPTYSAHQPENELVADIENRLIKQTFSRSTDDLGTFETNPPLFSLKSGQIVRIEMYMWLEGQDVDCSNIMHNATVKGEELTKLLANIQFNGSTEGQSGMVPIGE